MPDLNFDDVRKKISEDLSPEEQQLLIDNRDKLNDEDKEAYADFLPREEKPDNTNEITNPADNKPIEDKKGGDDKVTTPPPVFTSQEQIDKWFEEKYNQKVSQLATTAPPATTPPPSEKVFFKPGEVPSDWNDVAKRIYSEAKEDAKKEWQEMTAKEKAEIKDKQEKAQKAMDGFQAEYDALAKDGKVPARDTDDGKKTWESIWKVGDKYGQANITDSYNLWANLSSDLGGGYKATTPEEIKKETQKKNISEQKKVAAKMSHHGQSKSIDIKPTRDYKTLHKSSMQDLIDSRLD